MANKKRLIDADKIYDAVERRYQVSSGIYHRCERDLLDLICAADIVDAVEVPPVKIGDKAFFIVNGKIYEAEICLITCCQFRRTGKKTELRGEVTKNHTVSANFSDWGKTVFATKEDAERVLYPCEYCFCETYRSCEGCSYGERRTDG